jgi:hypothetical protein
MAPSGPAPQPCASLPPFACPVTAVALAPAHVPAPRGGHVCAVGLEDGGLQVWAVLATASSGGDGDGGGGGGGGGPRLLWSAPPGEGHAAAVRRIGWAPAAAGGGGAGPNSGAVLLASCGEDHAVRVFEVEM